jgi:hypothetical protein
MKNLTTLFYSILAATAIQAQSTWQSLPPNPADAAEITSHDIASASGYSYFIYAREGSSHYEIVFDAYTEAGGWQTIHTYETDNDQGVTVHTAQSGNTIFVMTNRDNVDKLVLFKISGTTVTELNSHVFSGFSGSAFWNIYPGPSSNELFFMYGTKLEVYSLSGNSWGGTGNVYSGSGVTPTAATAYVTADSVFVAAQFSAAGTPKIRLLKAKKGVWSWSNYTAGTNNLHSWNGTAMDTVTGSGQFFIYGNGSEMLVLAKDNNTAIEIPAAGAAYGDRTAFALDYDNSSAMSSDAAFAYIMTGASNMAEPNLVYRRNFATGQWSQMTLQPFATGTVTPASKRIRNEIGSTRVMIAYQSGGEFHFALSGEEPVITSNGTASTVLCSNAETSLLTNMTIEDPDQDVVTLVSVTSSNESLIDPDLVDVDITSPSAGLSVVNATVIPGNVSGEQTVTLTFTFTDGEHDAEAEIEYTLVPNATAAFTTSELTLCSNGDLIDLYDYVTGAGGVFTVFESPFNHYFDPADQDPEVSSFEIVYSITTGGCVSQDELEIDLIDAPEASISTQGTTNCDQNDGTATLNISGGTPPYNFTWNTGNNTDLTVTGLDAGSVHADIADNAGCLITADAIVYNDAVSVTGTVTPISCHGDNDGAIAVTVTGMADPVSVLWSSGHSTLNVSDLQPGAHQIWVSDATGCQVTESFMVDEPEEISIGLQPEMSDCGGQNGSVSIASLTGGTAPYTYEWSNGTTGETMENVGSGIYTLIVIDDNGCQASKRTGVSDDGAPYAELISVTEAGCNLSDGEIAVNFVNEGTNPIFTWSTGLSNNNLLVGVEPGDYNITGANDEGCESHAIYNVPSRLPKRQDICVVTVDEQTTTNLLVWEKNEASDIDHYNVYRESVLAGQFQWIDSVPADSISIFNDVVASPAVRSWSYRISAVDVCDVESVPSTIHKTIHLNTNEIGGGQYKVVWNNYQGIPVSGYNFYRYTTAAGWEQITVTATGVSDFTDAPSDIVGLDYMVDFDLESPCIADFFKAQDFNSSRSNKDRAIFNPGSGTGGESNGIDEAYLGTISVYPNPVSDKLVISQNAGEMLQIEIRGIGGNLLHSMETSQLTSELNTGELAAGIYMVTVKAGSASRTERIVKK